MDKFILFFRDSRKIVNDHIIQFQSSTRFDKLLHWGKLISITGAAQILVQGVGFISGILVIRFLAIEEYALYTIANTMLGTMYLLADGGISAGVLSQGGKVWQDKKKLGAVVATGLHLRKRFALISLIISIPILVYLLSKHEASWLMIGLITISLIPAFYAQLADAIYGVVPKLHQDISRFQKNEIFVGIGRLLLTTSFIFIFPFTFLALLANGIPRIFGNLRLRKISTRFANVSQAPDPEIKQHLLSTVKHIMPGLIYFCLSGQITVWLISFFGSTTALAQLGALGRLAIILSLFSGLVSTLIVPRFARLIEEKKEMFKFYIQILSGVGVLVVLLVAFISVFSSEVLFIIGENYSGLHWELYLTLIGAGLSLIAHISFLLNISRDWVMHPAISIIISLISLLIGVLIFDVSTLQGVLAYNIFLALVQVLLNGFYGLHRIKEI